MACMGSLVDNFDNSNIVILMFIIIILMFLGYIIIHIFSGCSNICVCWQCYNSLEWTQMSTLQQKQFFLHVQPSRSQLNMSRRKRSFYVFFKKPTWSNMINYSWSSSMKSDLYERKEWKRQRNNIRDHTNLNYIKVKLVGDHNGVQDHPTQGASITLNLCHWCSEGTKITMKYGKVPQLLMECRDKPTWKCVCMLEPSLCFDTFFFLSIQYINIESLRYCFQYFFLKRPDRKSVV